MEAGPVVKATSPKSLLDTYHAERHPVAAACCATPWPQQRFFVAQTNAPRLSDTISELLKMDEPRKRFAAVMSGLDIQYDLGMGTRCLGAACPILTWSP